jgi:hypothetical protein
MLEMLASRIIMARTTIALDDLILAELKARARRERKSLGQLVSELVAETLKSDQHDPRPEFRWVTKPMDAKVDLEDKERVQATLDGR